MKIPFILTRQYPDDEWILEGEDDHYAGLIWKSTVTKKPTLSKLLGLWDTTYAAQYAAEEVRKERGARYAERSIGDQLDAIIKAFNQLRLDGASIPADMNDLINWSLAIKAEIPKPDET